MEKHESVMHMIADALVDMFDASGAVNYIEQTFESKEDSSRSFVLTMQMKDGLTPCEKLSAAEDRITQLEKDKAELVGVLSTIDELSRADAFVDNYLDDVVTPLLAKYKKGE